MRPSARLLLACLLAMIPGLMWPGRPTRAQDGPRPGWFGSARHCIDDREFELTRLSGSGAETWQAPNRAHRIRTTFSPERVRVVPRNGQAFVPWTLEWSVAVWERDGVAWPASRATLVPDGRRVEFRRGAAPLEWYENTPRGLEQKFLIRAPRGPERPCRRAPFPERVQIDLRLGGDVSPRLRDGGQEIDFVTASGARALHLGPLRAVDARGRVLAARYESWERSDGRGLRYVVDVSGAVDPIRLEAIVNDSGWAAESEQPGASFGLSVATAGDVNGDGYSDIIVGAPHFDAGQEDEGRVFAYFGSAAGPSASPDWSAEGDQAHALFGSAVAAAGDVNGDGYGDLVVGAPRFDDGDEDVGGAFVYLGSPSGPGDSPVWMGEGTRPFAGFGTSVATAGDVNGDGRDDLLVGAPRHAEGGVEQGAAFLYLGSAAGPADQPAWVATGGQPGGRFGERVAAAGDVNGDGRSDIAVGAPRQDDGDMEEGRVFVYLGSTTGLSAGPDWSAEIDQPGALFGSSLAAGDVNGDGYGDLVVGAPFFEDHEDDEGHAFGYFGSAGGLGAGPEWVGECNQPSAGFGTSVSAVGDVNGDGFDDILAGIPRHDEGQVHEGATFLYLGSAAGPRLDPDWTTVGGWPGIHFGTSASGAGDVNGDGYSDIVVGAPEFSDGEAAEGRALLYYGHGFCEAPDLPVFIAGARHVPGTNGVVLDFEDPNPTGTVTGYIVYRAADPALDPALWPRIAFGIGDADPAAPGLQWEDETGADPTPGGAWFYQITPFDAVCAAEGPR